MPNFLGQLHVNRIMGSLYNMIISQRVLADNIAGTYSELVDEARVDAGLYGDTKLYTATDVLVSHEWVPDSSDATNLLELHRPLPPKTQAIVVDKFRQIPLTVDKYLSKRAWMGEGIFSEFTAVILGWMSDTKRIYDSTKYNSFIGTTHAEGAGQAITFALPARPAASAAASEKEATNRLRAQTIGQRLADLFIDLADVSRKYNDYGFLRSYSKDRIKVIWNSKYVNEIRKISLPTIFHEDGVVQKLSEHILPSRYFGDVKDTDLAASANTVANKYRSLIEKDYNTVKQNNASYDKDKHIFPGDFCPTGVKLVAGEYYEPTTDVIAKILVELPPYCSAFETGTDFFNARNLSENHYLTFSHNTLEYLKGYPFITVTETAAA